MLGDWPIPDRLLQDHASVRWTTVECMLEILLDLLQSVSQCQSYVFQLHSMVLQRPLEKLSQLCSQFAEDSNCSLLGWLDSFGLDHTSNRRREVLRRRPQQQGATKACGSRGLFVIIFLVAKISKGKMALTIS